MMKLTNYQKLKNKQKSYKRKKKDSEDGHKINYLINDSSKFSSFINMVLTKDVALWLKENDLEELKATETNLKLFENNFF